jgi:hypothetical protein
MIFQAGMENPLTLMVRIISFPQNGYICEKRQEWFR